MINNHESRLAWVIGTILIHWRFCRIIRSRIPLQSSKACPSPSRVGGMDPGSPVFPVETSTFFDLLLPYIKQESLNNLKILQVWKRLSHFFKHKHLCPFIANHKFYGINSLLSKILSIAPLKISQDICTAFIEVMNMKKISVLSCQSIHNKEFKQEAHGP